jgi:threonine synthase
MSEPLFCEADCFDILRKRIREDVMKKPPIQASTVADSIFSEYPRELVRAMAAVQQTGGAFLEVTDEEILAAIPTMARGSGVFAESSGAAPYAGLVKAIERGFVASGESAVIVNTGNGLKDVAAAMKSVSQLDTAKQYRIEPNLDALTHQLDNWISS